jgi:hypothetical protein
VYKNQQYWQQNVKKEIRWWNVWKRFTISKIKS